MVSSDTRENLLNFRVGGEVFKLSYQDLRNKFKSFLQRQDNSGDV